jgi:hypothetical protein
MQVFGKPKGPKILAGRVEHTIDEFAAERSGVIGSLIGVA